MCKYLCAKISNPLLPATIAKFTLFKKYYNLRTRLLFACSSLAMMAENSNVKRLCVLGKYKLHSPHDRQTSGVGIFLAYINTTRFFNSSE